MKGHSVRKGHAMTIPGGAVYGATFALLWTLVGSCILSWLIHTERVQEEATGYGSLIILLTASILSALLSYSIIKRQRVVACMSAGGVYLLMLMAITAMFFGGQFTGFGVTALVILGGCAVAIFLSMEHGNRKTGKGRKIRI